MHKIALVTDSPSLPIDYDMPLLIEACESAGLVVEVRPWDDAGVEWGAYDAVVIRSPWSYVERLSDFLTWCEDVSSCCRLFNPVSVVRWNLNKRYMSDLAQWGTPIVPTSFVAHNDDAETAIRKIFSIHLHVDNFVVKPTVGAYSHGVKRFSRGSEEDAVKHVTQIIKSGREAMLQPYVDAIDETGETDLIFFNGEYSHAIRKSALLLSDGTVNVPSQDVRMARDAEPEERAVALNALNAAVSCLGLDDPLLYARLDLVRSDDGSPVVLEMEVCEPSLSLPFTDVGAKRFAEALVKKVSDFAVDMRPGVTRL